MSLPIVFRLEAQTEFDEAIDWYEQQAELGLEFLDCVAETLTRIQAMPESYEMVFEDVRRSVVQRFPYSVFYQVEAQQIVVLAIFHGKRDPKIWQARRGSNNSVATERCSAVGQVAKVTCAR